MSDILIKGMEMPTKCIICPLEMYGYCLANNKKNVGKSVVDFVTDEDCPLVPVPPHGRCIDADALIKELTLDDEDDNSGASLLMAIFIEVLKAAPTIIPTSEEGK